MRNVIIGTAGHVDHGKTALIKALTGIDTDRLREEKKRGITIELGFAYIDFDDGSRAGVIDVPGHENFIRNMLAGAGGVDLAMLIVAADEGVMPQTVEHLNILSLLGIHDGLVVVTKTDLADEDWLELVTEDVETLTEGTFLQGRPVVRVSACTGEGLTELKRLLRERIEALPGKDEKKPFRLPVDRVFPIDGFGTVVTGTLIEGSVKTGEAAEVLPSGEPVTIRNIQVHGSTSPEAHAGQRVALNLSGVKMNEVKRGDVVASRGSAPVTGLLDVRLDALKNSAREIKNGSTLHLYHGAAVSLAKVSLIGRSEALMPGESCYAQLWLKEQIAAKRGDRFVLRFFSPLETIGGGVILDPGPPKRRRSDPLALEALKIRESGGAGQRIYQLSVEKKGALSSSAELRALVDLSDEEYGQELEALVRSGKLFQLLPGRFVSDKALERYSEQCVRLLSDYHKSRPLDAGLKIAELRQKLCGKADTAEGNAVLAELERRGIMRVKDGRAALAGFEPSFSARQAEIRDMIQNAFKDAGYDSPAPDELSSLLPQSEKEIFSQVFARLVSDGEFCALAPGIYWHREAYDSARRVVKEHFDANRELTMPKLRDMLGTSRKYALAFLEHLDSAKITKKIGDARVIFRGFDG